MENKSNFETELIFSMGEINKEFKKYFVGESYRTPLAKAPDGTVNVGQVTFEPGCRNNWHVHLDGYQILLVTAGSGLYQEEGKEVRQLNAGDVVVTNKGVKHWHGATKNSWFAHIAVTSGSTDFFEPVSDTDYNNANGL